MLDRYMKVNEVAQVLQVTPHTVRMHIRDGRLRAVRLTRRGPWYVTESDLRAALERS